MSLKVPDNFQVIFVDKPTDVPRHRIMIVARKTLDAVLKFYEDPKNVQEFEEWLKKREVK